MNTEQQAQQLRLAADILETGHPWEMRHESAGVWHKGQTDIGQAIIHRWEIRLALATPPDGRPLHNPDNLTAEQVGAGWRLATYGEPASEDMEVYLEHREPQWQPIPAPFYGDPIGISHGQGVTIRVHLSTPWPEAVDPYAELKAAHAAGKVIQYNCGSVSYPEWNDVREPAWGGNVNEYRIKPEPRRVPLGPEDVPPGSVFRRDSKVMCQPISWLPECMEFHDSSRLFQVTWQEFADENWQINRSIPLTGQWNPDAWEPCGKEVEA